MNWPLADCFRYRTAFWQLQGREVRLIGSAAPTQNIQELAG